MILGGCEPSRSLGAGAQRGGSAGNYSEPPGANWLADDSQLPSELTRARLRVFVEERKFTGRGDEKMDTLIDLIRSLELGCGAITARSAANEDGRNLAVARLASCRLAALVSRPNAPNSATSLRPVARSLAC